MTDERGRTDRQAEVRQERRRRDDATIDGGQRLKLAVPSDVAKRLESEGRTARWVTDEGNRIQQLTRMDDYDVVEGVEPVPVVVDRKSGKVANQILLSKPTRFVQEDRAKAEERRKETERALLRGKNPKDPSAANDSFYADPANQITHGGLGPP
jgi:hypothetical protein